MRYPWLIILLALITGACTPIAQSSVNSDGNPKTLRLTDFAYEPQIKTVQLSPPGGGKQGLEPAVYALGQGGLRLAFDDLRDQRDSYYARIVHCNHDWTKSDLQDLDFMMDYNEFTVSNFEFSVDTHVPYVHYWLDLPRVKLPGNYVVIVFRGSDKNDIILSRRFMVYDSRVTLSSDRNLVGAGSIAAINQQINFTINYKNIDILNPMADVHVVIRQNQRWDNVATDIRPTFIRELQKELEYRFFDDTKMFRGGNEFRFFDLRSLIYPGRNVDRVIKTVKPWEAYVATDKSREYDAYAQYVDMNGGYLVDNLDYRDASFTNYVKVNFELTSKEPVAGDVYVAGGFNYWNTDANNKMQYDSARRLYTAKVLLKQGWYDYSYLVKSSSLPAYHFEGSHYETENSYEIFVYYKPFQPRADLLIGYVRLEKNAR